jgi:hypothetical protein
VVGICGCLGGVDGKLTAGQEMGGFWGNDSCIFGGFCCVCKAGVRSGRVALDCVTGGEGCAVVDCAAAKNIEVASIRLLGWATGSTCEDFSG